ncbi:hypothetical protein BJ165DRAFT_1546236 [Panaeolus papilionaceus]|nr:hypothetical protein BJ165DRAFT_1546236 [Panaeolus papilionaceus]
MSNSPSLLAHRNPNVSLSAYDGKVGAIIGDCIYTTPNESFIPLPPRGDREVLVRQDYRYGVDDHTLWPQSYSNLVPHLAVIPRKSTSPNDPLAPLWRDPQESHFIQSSQGSIVSNIGILDPVFLEPLELIAKQLRLRFFSYAKSLPEGKNPNVVAACLERISGFTLNRLLSLRTSWTQIRFTLTELQRLLLELRGCLDYLEIYKPMLDLSHMAPSNPSTIPTMGALTTNARVVEEFNSVGIPVWFVRRQDVSDFGNNVLAEVEPVDYRKCLVMEKHPDFPPVFKGKRDADSFTVVTHVLQFSRHWLSSPNPFSNPTELSSSSSSLSPSSTQQASSSSSNIAQQSSSRGPDGRPPTKKAKITAKPPKSAGRDKFEPYDSPFAPYPIPAWTEQLRKVDRSRPPSFDRLPYGTHYAFPDPGLFMSVKTDTKRQFMIEQYCRIANVWVLRTHQAPGKAMSNQQWRELLSIDFRLPPSQWAAGSTYTASRHRETLKQLVPPGCTIRAISPTEPFVLMGPEESYPSGTLPPNESLRKFAFFLYWLNFRSEVIALDAIAHEDLNLKDPQAVLLREQRVNALFPVETLLLPLFDPPNIGLVADTIRGRLPFLRTFAKLMSSWKGDKPAIFRLGRPQAGADDHISQGDAMALEKEVAGFYCQQFFNYFGRAAQIPHHLYPPSTAAS